MTRLVHLAPPTEQLLLLVPEQLKRTHRYPRMPFHHLLNLVLHLSRLQPTPRLHPSKWSVLLLVNQNTRLFLLTSLHQRLKDLLYLLFLSICKALDLIVVDLPGESEVRDISQTFITDLRLVNDSHKLWNFVVSE